MFAEGVFDGAANGMIFAFDGRIGQSRTSVRQQPAKHSHASGESYAAPEKIPPLPKGVALRVTFICF